MRFLKTTSSNIIFLLLRILHNPNFKHVDELDELLFHGLVRLVSPARLDADRVLGLLTRTRADMTEDELDAAVAGMAALDAGVLQSLNQQSSRETKHESWGSGVL
jgi:hypothetical protein